MTMSRQPRTADGQRVFDRLEAERSGLGHSRQDLADAVGVHYQTIGYLERGEYSPSLALALRIARFLGKPVEELFSLEEFQVHPDRVVHPREPRPQETSTHRSEG